MTSEITAVRRRQGRATIFTAEGEQFSFPGALLRLRPLRPGQVIDIQEYLALVKAHAYPFAVKKVTDMQSSRDHSTAEIRRTLQRQAYPEDIIERVISEFTDVQLVNDARFAGNFAAKRIRGRGVSVIRQEMRMKGVPEREIEDALGQLNEETQLAAIRRLAERLERNSKDRRHIIAALMRRGYPYGMITKALSEQKE